MSTGDYVWLPFPEPVRRHVDLLVLLLRSLGYRIVDLRGASDAEAERLARELSEKSS